MRFLPPLLVLVIALAGHLPAQTNNDPITTVGTIPDKTIKATLGSSPINLSNYFAVPSITGQAVQFTTAGVGTFNVEMNVSLAPNTVANFLAYVDANRFANTIVHRLDKSLGVIQSGGFFANPAANTINQIVRNPAIALETGDSLANTRGRIAMGQLPGDVNSATSEWFINTTNNSATLPAANAGGYAAFGRVTGTGMTVVDAIAALQLFGGNVTVISSTTTSKFVTVDAASLPSNFGPGWLLLGGTVQNVIGNFVTLSGNANQNISASTTVSSGVFPPFYQLPLLSNLPADGSLFLSNFVTISTVKAVPIFPTGTGTPSVVTFSAVSANPGLVNATISGSSLYLTAAKNLPGTSSITVTATDANGNAVSQTAFTVTVQRQAVDYNGNSNTDSNADLLFQNALGQIIVWYVNASGTHLGSNWISRGAAGDWILVGVADMNGDGNPDLIFQNTIGQIIVWYMDGTGARIGANFISTGAAGDWRVVGVADMNNDGNNDLIFQNTIGQIIVWYMNGAGARIGANFISTGAAGDWRVVGVGDMNSDGNADLVFQNTIGQIIVWYMDGTGARIGANFISTGAAGDWRVMRVADMNYDGNADLIFQNRLGQIIVWYMDGTGARIGANFISTGAAGDWRVR